MDSVGSIFLHIIAHSIKMIHQIDAKNIPAIIEFLDVGVPLGGHSDQASDT